MEAIKYVLVGVLTSSAVVGLFVFIVRKFIEARLKFYFDSSLQEIKRRHQIELSELRELISVKTESQKETSKEKYAAYKELSNIGYRCQNLARDMSRSSELLSSESVRDEFRLLTQSLEHALFNWRIILYGEIFDLLHVLKEYLVAFRVLCDYAGNRETDIGRNELLHKYQDIDASWNALIKRLQEEHASTVAYNSTPNK